MPHGVEGQVDQSLGRNRCFSNHEHPAGVAEPAVLDDGHVDVDDVALFQRLVVGNAVADHVVDRGAQRSRVGRVTGGLVTQRGRNGALLLQALGSQAVDLAGGDAGLDVGREVVQHFGGQPPRVAHALDAHGVLVRDAHEAIIPEGSHRRSQGSAALSP